MKFVVASLALFVGLSAQADKKWMPIKCVINTSFEKVAPKTLVVTLKQIGLSDNFELQITDSRNPSAQPLLRDVVHLSVEDVNADFRGPRSAFRIYLDEWDQAYFTNPKTGQNISFKCDEDRSRK